MEQESLRAVLYLMSGRHAYKSDAKFTPYESDGGDGGLKVPGTCLGT